MTQEAKQSKKNLEALIKEFDHEYYKVLFSGKREKIGKKLYISYGLSSLFVIIKKYLREVESSKSLAGFIKALKHDIKINENSDALFGQNLNKLKNTKTKSYSWLYYSLFKGMAGEASILSESIQKILKSADREAAKEMIENTIKQIEQIKKDEEEIIKLNLDTMFRPKIYKKFLKDFHKSIIPWLDINIMTSEFIDDIEVIDKEPLASKWENIEIKFDDEYNVKLIIDDKEEKSDYDKLGFADKRQDSSSKAYYVKSWYLLMLFAINNRTINLPRIANNKSKKETFKKYKQDLSRRLKNRFNLKDDPIDYDPKNKEYIIKLKLTFTPEFRESWFDRNIFEDTPKGYLGNP